MRSRFENATFNPLSARPQTRVRRCPGEGFGENEEGLSQNNRGSNVFTAAGVMNDLGCALQQVIADEISKVVSPISLKRDWLQNPQGSREAGGWGMKGGSLPMFPTIHNPLSTIVWVLLLHLS